jgi:hypothetical protein
VSIEPRWIWRIVACLGVCGCTSFARMCIDGYVRHRATGDQAGFALGMTALVFGLVPATSTALVLGTVPGPSIARRIGAGGWLARLAVSGALLAGAAFFLWIPAHIRAMVAQDRPPGPAEPTAALSFESAAAGVLIAFALLQAACAAVILWPGAARSWWFSALLVAVGVAAVAATVIVTGLSGPAALIVAVPWVAWIAVVAWVWRAGRPRL